LLNIAAESIVAAGIAGLERFEPDFIERDPVRLVVDLRLIGLRSQGDAALERDDGAGFRQRQCLPTFLCGDEIERAELILFSPPSPVGQLRHPAVGLSPRHRRPAARRSLRLRTIAGTAREPAMKSLVSPADPTVITGLPVSFFVQPARFSCEPANSGSQKRRVEQ